MKNVIDIKKNLKILKKLTNQLITITIMQILNQFVLQLKNKRNNFNKFIFKLKNTRFQEILSSNTFKSYQNSIVFFSQFFYRSKYAKQSSNSNFLLNFLSIFSNVKI